MGKKIFTKPVSYCTYLQVKVITVGSKMHDNRTKPFSIETVILLPAHPASFAHKFLFQRVPASPGMQYYGRLVIKNSVLTH